MLTDYDHLLIFEAEQLGAISVRPLIDIADHQQVPKDDLRRWLVGLKESEEYKHLFRHDLPSGSNWTHVAIPAANSVQDYDEPVAISIEGALRNLGMMGQQVSKTKVQMAYFFQTETEAREWWSEHGHKFEVYLRGLKSKIYSLYTPVDPD